MPYAIKPVNELDGFTKLKADDLQSAFSEAEKLIVSSRTANITALWVVDTAPRRVAAVWVPGRGGWTNI